MACLVTRAALFDKDEWTKCKSGKFSKLPARWAMKSVCVLSFEGTIHEDPVNCSSAFVSLYDVNIAFMSNESKQSERTSLQG